MFEQNLLGFHDVVHGFPCNISCVLSSTVLRFPYYDVIIRCWPFVLVCRMRPQDFHSYSERARLIVGTRLLWLSVSLRQCSRIFSAVVQRPTRRFARE